MTYNYRDIPQIVREILAAKAEDGGVKNVYFVGCGGSLGTLYPAKVFVERESLGLKTGWINSNEFVHSTPKDFGKNSVLCVACHAGNTPETVAAAKLGKETRPDIHLGICGEHGGDPTSVEFCHKVGLNYVSCSPYRVPIARLAAAQAAIKHPRAN